MTAPTRPNPPGWPSTDPTGLRANRIEMDTDTRPLTPDCEGWAITGRAPIAEPPTLADLGIADDRIAQALHLDAQIRALIEQMTPQERAELVRDYRWPPERMWLSHDPGDDTWAVSR